jgi:hypothetical protein
MPVDSQQTAWRYIPEDGTLHNHRSENLISYITVKSFQLLLMTMSHNLNHMDGIWILLLLLKTELPIIYSSEIFYEVIFRAITTNLNMELPETVKLSALLLTIPTTNVSSEWIFSALKKIHT